MRTLAFLLVGLALVGCAHAVRDLAVSGCRNAGYLGAVEDNGLWYCFKGPPLTPPQPQ